MDLRIYTDGSYSGKSRRGGYATLLLNGDVPLICVASGYDGVTNNQMELEAIRQALILVSGFKKTDYKSIPIHTDSAYAIGCLTKWYGGWVRKNWKTSQQNEVANRYLIEDSMRWLSPIGHRVELVKVKGHSGNRWNEAVDIIAKNVRDGICDCGGYNSCIFCKKGVSPEWLAKKRPKLATLIKKQGGRLLTR